MTGGHPTGGSDVVGLETLNGGETHLGGEVNILAVGLEEPRPERLAADVEDGGEVPRDARGSHLNRSDLVGAS